MLWVSRGGDGEGHCRGMTRPGAVQPRGARTSFPRRGKGEAPTEAGMIGG